MTDAGARSPASPPKPPALPAAKPLANATTRAPMVGTAAAKQTLPLTPKPAPVQPTASPPPARVAPSPATPPVKPRAPSVPDAAEVLEERAPAAAPPPAVFDRDVVRAIVRVAVDDAVEPLERTIAELRRRIEELERRPAAAAPAPALAPAPAPSLAPALVPASSVPPRILPSTAPRGALDIPISIAPPPGGPLLDVNAIDRSMGDIDVPFDGRRRRRILVAFVLLIFLGLAGGLLGFLAYNNSTSNVVAPETPAST